MPELVGFRLSRFGVSRAAWNLPQVVPFFRTHLEEEFIKQFAVACISAVALISVAHAASTTMSGAPTGSVTITDYYKQDVYDPQQSKIGSVDDVLVDKTGKVTALVIGVGGFLGAGEKDVIVPFNSVKNEKKNDKWYLTLDESKDSLKSAPGAGL